MKIAAASFSTEMEPEAMSPHWQNFSRPWINLKFEVCLVKMLEVLYSCRAVFILLKVFLPCGTCHINVPQHGLALVLLYCSDAAVPLSSQGDEFAAMLLPWFCFGFGVLLPFPVAMQLLCHRCGFALLLCCFRCWWCWAGPLWPMYDLCPCRSSCPPPAAGHWATFTPLTGLLSTLLFLPLDSSIFLTKLSHRSSTLFLL